MDIGIQLVHALQTITVTGITACKTYPFTMESSLINTSNRLLSDSTFVRTVDAILSHIHNLLSVF